MRRILTKTLFIASFLVAAQSAHAAREIETSHLIIRDPKNALTSKQFAEFGKSGQGALESILQYWSTSARIDRFGKIVLEYNAPRAKRGVAVFGWRKENNKRVRIVGVWGKHRNTEMMVQKLTHAVFPNKDKLLRNMLSIGAEAALGNPLSFPMCGYDTDAWVLALRQAKSYVPLSELGPGHESWGMGVRSGLPYVKDTARQQNTYTEAGSFGIYLIDTYGVSKVKAFNVKSASAKRPWKQVFGLTLSELEKAWLGALATKQKRYAAQVSSLVKIWKRDRKRACLVAKERPAE